MRARHIRGEVSIHACTPSDADGVAHLVELGELTVTNALTPGLIVGELDHKVVAALAPDGTLATDPFAPTAETCELLQLRGRQLGWPLRRADLSGTPLRLLQTWYRQGRIG